MSEHKDYIENIEGAERRYFVAPVTIEKRAEGDDKRATIEGYAALVSSPTNISDWYIEEILPGAFDDVLNDDVRCLFNHNPNYVLARSKEGKGTLTLSVDEKGLKYSYQTPNRSYAIDLEDAISEGDVSQSSFAFRVKESIWIEGSDGELDKRQIKKFKEILDVSPVTYPAYQDTTVAKRSHETFKAKSIDVDVEDAHPPKRTKTVHEAQVIINKNKVLK